MDSQPEKIETCLGKTEDTDLEANPEEIESIAEQQKVPEEEGAMKAVGALKKRHGDGHLDVGRSDS
jgi:hypothetical protein